eukprot:g2760.t1
MSEYVDPSHYENNGRRNEEEGARTEFDRVKLRVITAVTRGAATGFILRGGITLFGSLLTLITKKKKSNSDRQPLIEILRMSLFLASLGGTYVLTDESIGAYWGKKKTSSWRGMIAGLLAGPSILLLGSKVRHDSLAIYVFVRSLTLLVRCGNRSTKFRFIKFLLSPTRASYGDVVIMCLTTAQIMYSYIMMPHTLPKSYKHFLTRQTCRPMYVWETLREMAKSEKCSKGIPADDFIGLKGTGHIPFCSSIPCELLHPNQSCIGNLFTVFPECYSRALSVYLPVYLAPALLVHRKKLITNADVILPKLALGIFRSSLFLASVVSLAYASCCSVHNMTGSTNGWTLAGALLIPGLGLLNEKKSRRMELALYALSRAAESFSLCLVDWGYLTPVKWRFDVALFSVATAFITHCYSDDEGVHRHSFRSKHPRQSWRIRVTQKRDASDDALIQVGIIGGTHGLNGELRVQPTSDFEEERLGSPGLKLLQAPPRGLIRHQMPSLIHMESLGGRPHVYKGHALWILQFDGVSTPEEAKRLSGYRIMIKADERETLSGDEYYIQDLIGMEVVQQEDQKLIGIVDSVFPGDGAADILFVKLMDAECKEPALIPFVERFVPVVDVEHCRIEVTLPDGMIEIANLKPSNKKSSKKNGQL